MFGKWENESVFFTGLLVNHLEVIDKLTTIESGVQRVLSKCEPFETVMTTQSHVLVAWAMSGCQCHCCRLRVVDADSHMALSFRLFFDKESFSVSECPLSLFSRHLSTAHYAISTLVCLEGSGPL